MNTYDDLLQAYLDATAALKAAEEAKDALRVQLMAEAPHNTSQAFTVKITESTSDRIESLKAIYDKSPSLHQALHDVGAIKQVVSTRVSVKALTKS